MLFNNPGGYSQTGGTKTKTKLLVVAGIFAAIGVLILLAMGGGSSTDSNNQHDTEGLNMIGAAGFSIGVPDEFSEVKEERDGSFSFLPDSEYPFKVESINVRQLASMSLENHDQFLSVTRNSRDSHISTKETETAKIVIRIAKDSNTTVVTRHVYYFLKDEAWLVTIKSGDDTVLGKAVDQIINSFTPSGVSAIHNNPKVTWLS